MQEHSRYPLLVLTWEEILEIHADVTEAVEWIYDKLKNKKLYLQVKLARVFWVHEDKFRYDECDTFFEPIWLKVHSEGNFNEETLLETKKVDGSIEYFLQALSRFPVSAVFRCENCGKIVFNPTKRKKIYCSTRCQNTAAVRRFRERS